MLYHKCKISHANLIRKFAYLLILTVFARFSHAQFHLIFRMFAMDFVVSFICETHIAFLCVYTKEWVSVYVLLTITHFKFIFSQTGLFWALNATNVSLNMRNNELHEMCLKDFIFIFSILYLSFLTKDKNGLEEIRYEASDWKMKNRRK